MRILIEGSILDNNVSDLARQLEVDLGLPNFSMSTNSITDYYLENLRNSKINLILTTQTVLWSLLKGQEFVPNSDELVVHLRSSTYFEDLSEYERLLFAKVFRARTGLLLPVDFEERPILSSLSESNSIIQVNKFDLFDTVTVLREKFNELTSEAN